ncbi:MAG: hypothetical protein JW889_09900 [Verrucomicrobia bacterium]|nr:hypothetical protein [Verrucomicrobiota bacterium]
MKKSETLMLVVTVGLGVILGATRLPGRGRTHPAPGASGDGASPAAVTTEQPRATLELLAAGRAELTVMPETLGNPFRSLPDKPVATGVAIVLRVTAVFGQERDADTPAEGQRTALLRGERLTAGTPADGPVVRLDADTARVDAYLKGEHVQLAAGDALLVALLRGKLVHAGDVLGPITVEEVASGSVTLRHNGTSIIVKLRTQGWDTRAAGGAAEH